MVMQQEHKTKFICLNQIMNMPNIVLDMIFPLLSIVLQIISYQKYIHIASKEFLDI